MSFIKFNKNMIRELTIRNFKELPNKVYQLSWAIGGAEYSKLYTKASLLKMANSKYTDDVLKRYATRLFEEGKIK